MRYKTNTRSSLFLMELIVAILFFSLASAVCLRMFTKSHQLSTEAATQNHAVNQTGNVTELMRYDLTHETHMLADEYPDAKITDTFDESYIYYDGNWKPCEKANTVYTLAIRETTSSETLKKYELKIYDSNSSFVYALPLSVHIAQEVTVHE